MDIQTINTSSYTVYITGSELRARHIDPAGATGQQTRELLASALPELAEKEDEAMYVELYPGRDELLLFVHLCPGAPEFFAFEDSESVIAAALEYPGLPASSLTYLDGRYILTVYPPERAAVSGLWEFGETVDAPPEYELYLREHGQVIMDTDAVFRLKRHFSPEN